MGTLRGTFEMPPRKLLWRGGLMATILLVEDNRDIWDTLSEILEFEGHEVVSASNGQEALSQLRAYRLLPDCVVLDLAVPVMSGPELLNAMQERPEWGDIPVIICSGNTDDYAVARIAPLAACLRKPIDVPKLLNLIGTASSNGKPERVTRVPDQFAI